MLGGRDQETYADAVVERLGRSLANVEAFAWQQDRGRPIASARINFLLDRA
jgi:acyl-coenzyme A thioesterase PaaI-like protein